MAFLVKVFTLFPEIFPGPLGVSLVGKALAQGRWHLETVNIRDYAVDKHHRVDDMAFGGGPGMVLRPDVVDNALKAHYSTHQATALIYLSPRGKPLQQSYVKELARMSEIGLLCGRFEGVDQRVLEAWNVEEISIGDFVLSGGELPAMVLIDACVRLLPDVLGSAASLFEESFSSGLLEYPHYTRPYLWEGRAVPEVLRSGHHGKIKAWRQAMAEKTTQERRPDLWQAYLEQQQRKG
jgi:tRNA (guanine37-N1)-methyltransferase